MGCRCNCDEEEPFEFNILIDWGDVYSREIKSITGVVTVCGTEVWKTDLDLRKYDYYSEDMLLQELKSQFGEKLAEILSLGERLAEILSQNDGS